MKYRAFSSLVLAFALPMLAVSAHADSFGDLAAQNFAVLGSSTVTNVPFSTISGNVGVWSSGGANSITGFTNSTQVTGGTIQTGTASAMAAQGFASSAYTTLQGLSGSGLNLTGQNLGGLTLGAGAYYFSSSAQLTGTLTLNFGGASNEAIVIHTGSTLTTASGSRVVLEGANSTDSVYWAVGSAAAIGTTTSFEGNIIAEDTVAMNTGATDGCGSVTSLTAAVTLQMNTISTGCNNATTATIMGLGPGTEAVTPEPGTLALFSSGLLLMVFLTFRKSLVSLL
jgi:hypothetical protein